MHFSNNYDFQPELMIKDFKDIVQVTSETKLLGVIVTDDLKWEANTLYICAKAYKKMWILRRMKILDVEPLILLEVYAKEIRSVLELAVPAWHNSLTQKQSAALERVQKVAVSIILSDPITGKSEYSYEMGLVILDIEPLDERRLILCKRFAKKTLKSRHGDIFRKNSNQHHTRLRPQFSTNKCNTERFFNSPINFLTRILNGEE